MGRASGTHRHTSDHTNKRVSRDAIAYVEKLKKHVLKKMLSSGLDQRFYSLMFICPGCRQFGLVDEMWLCEHHHFMTKESDPNAAVHWQWNGDFIVPTVTPSIRVKMPWRGKSYCCHFHIRDGKLIYLPDCTHAFAGQTLTMLPIGD